MYSNYSENRHGTTKLHTRYQMFRSDQINAASNVQTQACKRHLRSIRNYLTRTAQIRCPGQKRHWRRCPTGARRPPGSRGSRAASASRPTRADTAVGAGPDSSAVARGPARRWTACVCRRTTDEGTSAAVAAAPRTRGALCVDGLGPAFFFYVFFFLVIYERIDM